MKITLFVCFKHGGLLARHLEHKHPHPRPNLLPVVLPNGLERILDRCTAPSLTRGAKIASWRGKSPWRSNPCRSKAQKAAYMALGKEACDIRIEDNDLVGETLQLTSKDPHDRSPTGHFHSSRGHAVDNGRFAHLELQFRSSLHLNKESFFVGDPHHQPRQEDVGIGLHHVDSAEADHLRTVLLGRDMTYLLLFEDHGSALFSNGLIRVDLEENGAVGQGCFRNHRDDIDAFHLFPDLNRSGNKIGVRIACSDACDQGNRKDRPSFHGLKGLSVGKPQGSCGLEHAAAIRVSLTRPVEALLDLAGHRASFAPNRSLNGLREGRNGVGGTNV